ncbi:MAG: hypothetical protein NWE89_15835 [Candidatus Bathyarchaeota archaeon]|nr:hypothetical protein [Candidatus Bathyarchaeota archaeon]
MPADQYDSEKGGPRPDFERQWRIKLNNSLRDYLPKDKAEEYRRDPDAEPEDLRAHAIELSRSLLMELESHDPEAANDVLTGCACQFPKSQLNEMKHVYAETKDLEKVHDMLQGQFVENTRGFLNLSDAQVSDIEERGWGVAGVIEGGRIIATKMPFDWTSYGGEEDPQMKRYHYCHCPRVRDIIKDGCEPVSQTYCNCGAGFYKGIWEYILDKPVKVEVLETVMHGGDVCKFAINLPSNM